MRTFTLWQGPVFKNLCFKAPYFRSIKPLFRELRPGYYEILLRKRRSVTNHIGSVHAIAMCNVSELAAGTMPGGEYPEVHALDFKGDDGLLSEDRENGSVGRVRDFNGRSGSTGGFFDDRSRDGQERGGGFSRGDHHAPVSQKTVKPHGDPGRFDFRRGEGNRAFRIAGRAPSLSIRIKGALRGTTDQGDHYAAHNAW